MACAGSDKSLIQHMSAVSACSAGEIEGLGKSKLSSLLLAQYWLKV